MFDEFIAFLKGQDRTRYEQYSAAHSFKFIGVTGYFSAGTPTDLPIAQRKWGSSIRLISPALDPEKRREDQDLDALRKMQDAGIEIRINARLHARMFVGYSNREMEKYGSGILLLGSHDFNRDSVSGQNRNAGIVTGHPGLVISTIRFFEHIWEDRYETKPLDLVYPPKT